VADRGMRACHTADCPPWLTPWIAGPAHRARQNPVSWAITTRRQDADWGTVTDADYRNRA
jgi:hypothetical protein